MSVAVLPDRPDRSRPDRPIDPVIDPASRSSVATAPRPAPGALPVSRAAVRTRRAVLPFLRWMAVVLAANGVTAALLVLLAPSGPAALTSAVTAASINIGMVVLVRHQYVVNALFQVATSAPLSWPLRIRAALAQVYQLPGGVHVGCALAAVGWLTAFTALTAVGVLSGPAGGLQIGVLAVAATILAVLGGMAVHARPSAREQHHDRFERTHRYGGWSSLALFAVLTVLTAASSGGSVGAAVAASPSTWVLLAVAVLIGIPWLQVRRVPVTVTTPSVHVAVLSVDRGRRVRTGAASRIARRPLGEWHSFATMTSPDSTAYRMAVSRAGDWTARFIADQPDSVWVRGVPTAGVVSVARLFHRVVWVATGSGIAPCLPQLLGDATPSQLVWITRNPERTYGPALVGEILTAQQDAIVWDTDAQGKPDLTQLAYRACKETGAEAVICVSNKQTTLRVVTELRERGIPAYGPIWDS
jgi:ferredoxin-NADP reductase